MKKSYSILVLLNFMLAIGLQAQTHNCALSKTDNLLLKKRMMQNRANTKDKTPLNKNPEETIYLPITFHSVRSNSGEGGVSETQVYKALCGLNSIFDDQGVQFFAYDQVDIWQNDVVDQNAVTTSSTFQMSNQKVNGTINVFTSRSQANPTASFYSPNADFIFVLSSDFDDQGLTLAHEIGHFLSLSHTFNGWEGTDVEATYGGGNVPSTVGSGFNSFSPERVARTGIDANCAFEGDGFCDTPADYYSSDSSCTYNVTVNDPLGVAIDPDESNFMSSASGQCHTNFSEEQKIAMKSDIQSRFWTSNTPPEVNDLTQLPVINPVAPSDGAIVDEIFNPSITLSWDSLPGSIWYHITVTDLATDGNVFFYEDYVYNKIPTIELPTDNLVDGDTYQWSVRVINNLSTCTSAGPNYEFTPVSTTTGLDKIVSDNILLSPNPTRNQLKVTGVNLEGAFYTVYSLSGKMINSLSGQLSQDQSIDVSSLSTGIYIIQFFGMETVYNARFTKL